MHISVVRVLYISRIWYGRWSSKTQRYELTAPLYPVPSFKLYPNPVICRLSIHYLIFNDSTVKSPTNNNNIIMMYTNFLRVPQLNNNNIIMIYTNFVSIDTPPCPHLPNLQPHRHHPPYLRGEVLCPALATNPA